MKRNSVIQVNLSAIRHNIEVLQAYLKPGVRQMAVVKSNAYGHGLVEVSKAIAPQVNWLAVNDVEEGIVLRKAGIKLPILVFIPPEKDMAEMFKKYDLTATISALHHFPLLPEGTEYHLNVDTGMGRLGFSPDDVSEVLQLKEKYNKLHCTGIYSHFATADEKSSPKVEQQYQQFKEIRSHFSSQILAHIANTAATVYYAAANFDMVRTGIGMYGYTGGDTAIPGLVPALQWKSQFVQVKPIKKGETVSYGACWECPDDGYIGIIPVGYADGLRRGLSRKMKVTINAQQFPIVGTITMNYCMVYLSQHRFEEGTEISIIDEYQTAEDMANVLGTISYEILTGISPHATWIYSP